MGILNVTPDSFSDGGLFFRREEAVAQGERLAEAGADILDVGGESSRPFAEAVALDEEIRRVIPVIETLAARLEVPISIDTYKAEVAERAIHAGATIVNDIGALRLDPAMAPLVARTGVPVVVMHMKGTPRTMQLEPRYEDVVGEVKAFLNDAVARACGAGIPRQQVIVDPGIGFGKTLSHNLLLLKHLSVLRDIGCPILVGPSRKSFIRKILDLEDRRDLEDGKGPGDERREVGTQAAVAAAALNGADIVRVHDVATTRDTLRIVDAVRNPYLVLF